jgi:hypothetical protein
MSEDTAAAIAKDVFTEAKNGIKHQARGARAQGGRTCGCCGTCCCTHRRHSGGDGHRRRVTSRYVLRRASTPVCSTARSQPPGPSRPTPTASLCAPTALPRTSSARP